MLVIPGAQDKATCDGMTRRELLRVGGGTVELIGLPGEVRKDLPRDFAQTMPPREANDSIARR